MKKDLYEIMLVTESYKNNIKDDCADYFGQFEDKIFQCYCEIVADNAMYIDSIFPYCGITILYVDVTKKEKLGNNDYTRKLALKQMVELSLYFHAMSHFYEEYKTINASFIEYENEELLRLHSQRFQTSKQEQGYKMNMNRLLGQYYRKLFQNVFSKFRSEVKIQRLMMPQYLLAQILKEYERIIERKGALPY